MKKLIFAFILVMSAIFVSCNRTSTKPADTDTITTVDTTTVDSITVDSTTVDTAL